MIEYGRIIKKIKKRADLSLIKQRGQQGIFYSNSTSLQREKQSCKSLFFYFSEDFMCALHDFTCLLYSL